MTVSEAGKHLRNKGVILHPTETVYGLAARWDSKTAIERVAFLKKRDVNKPMSVMVNSYEMIRQELKIADKWCLQICDSLFPGPVTLLISRPGSYDNNWWNQFDNIGIRFPNHNISLDLISTCDYPLITTSANVAGDPPVSDFTDLANEIINGVDGYIDGGKCEHSIPSTIIQLHIATQSATVIRQGSLSVDEIGKVVHVVKKTI